MGGPSRAASSARAERMVSPPRILVVDDEDYVRRSLAEVLLAEGLEVLEASSAEEAAGVAAREDLDVVLTDLRLSSADGMWLLEQVRAQDPGLPVVLFTGAGSVADAVQAMKAGAFDFLVKPVDPGALVVLVRRASEHKALLAEVGHLRREVSQLRGPRVLVGSSPAMERVRTAVAQVAPTDATVLIAGETGTGKELVADAIHRASRRAAGPLVELNCAAVPGELFESELFGHRRGAFTGAVGDRRGRFAEAEGGTLVLDEVGTLTPAMQAKLLRVLETGGYQLVGESRTRQADVRVIAVTNEDIEQRVTAGSFRADLYYRLNVFPLELPPLRARKEDLPELARHLLAPIRRAPGELEADALGVLAAYDWPGNVRELRNVLERATILAGPDAPPDAELLARLLGADAPPAGAPSGLRAQLDARERELVAEALTRTEGRRREAAELLGIDPRNLGYYLRKHGI
jgi:DNA-binding NtrC family response regulator